LWAGFSFALIAAALLPIIRIPVVALYRPRAGTLRQAAHKQLLNAQNFSLRNLAH
jgi:hypothetical protein